MKVSRIDHAIIEEIKSLQTPLSEDLFTKLVNIFVLSSAEKIKSMQGHFMTNDFRTLNDDVHALKSSAYRLGAMELAKQCEKMEDFLLNDSPAPDVLEIFTQIKIELHEALLELTVLVKESIPSK